MTEAHDWSRFIQANTRLLAPPLVPEIRLHLAEESLPIWRKTEEELGEMNVPPPYWAFAWAGGQAVSRWLIDNPGEVEGRTVLDLGAGAGLAAIAALKAGAVSALCADVDRVSLAAAQLNAQANGVTIAVTSDDLLAVAPRPFDIVIVGDLFYERALADRVTTYIEQAKGQRSLILIGDPQRSYFPRGRFEKIAEYRVPVTRELEDSEIKLTAVWRA